jgi:hypothetical protein
LVLNCFKCVEKKITKYSLSECTAIFLVLMWYEKPSLVIYPKGPPYLTLSINRAGGSHMDPLYAMEGGRNAFLVVMEQNLQSMWNTFPSHYQFWAWTRDIPAFQKLRVPFPSLSQGLEVITSPAHGDFRSSHYTLSSVCFCLFLPCPSQLHSPCVHCDKALVTGPEIDFWYMD